LAQWIWSQSRDFVPLHQAITQFLLRKNLATQKMGGAMPATGTTELLCTFAANEIECKAVSCLQGFDA
jgi:hypothetical protein